MNATYALVLHECPAIAQILTCQNLAMAPRVPGVLTSDGDCECLPDPEPAMLLVNREEARGRILLAFHSLLTTRMTPSKNPEM